MIGDPQQLSSQPSFDAEYRFARPNVYLTPRELARLLIVRSKLGDTHSEREANSARTGRTSAEAVHRVTGQDKG